VVLRKFRAIWAVAYLSGSLFNTSPSLNILLKEWILALRIDSELISDEVYKRKRICKRKEMFSKQLVAIRVSN